MHDLTSAETTPLNVGVQRYLCLWPDCDWFIDWDFGSWLEESADAGPIDVPSTASIAGDFTDAMHAIVSATALRYAGLVEASLVAHMDAEHPGWTVEALQRHAVAYGILGLMGHG